METVSDNTVQEALALIQNERALPHPSGPLLECFISEALQPQLAAAYVLHVCRSSGDQKAELFTLVSDWTYIVESITEYGNPPPVLNDETRTGIIRRDGSKCCITGKEAGPGDPLVTVPLLPVPSRWLDSKPRISEMLRAFFGLPYRDWWLAYAERPERMNPHYSHWLVRRSANDAFRRGLLTLNRLLPSMLEYRISPCTIGTLEEMIDLAGSFPLLGDHSRSGLPKVDARFVGTHARLAPSIRWLEVRGQINQNERVLSSSAISFPSRQERARKSWFPQLLSTTCLATWLTVPKVVRIATYRLLHRVGRYLYGGSDSFSVQRLPFNLYLKSSRSVGALRNEFNALNTIRRYTSVPVPRGLDLVSAAVRTPGQLDAEDAYHLTSRLPGVPLAHACDLLSDRDVREFVTQMQDFVTQLRIIPRPTGVKHRICDTLGEACRDPRIRDANPIGPFDDEESFSRYLLYPDDPARRGHDIVFTHADLNLRNILVDRVVRPDGTRGWQVAGIVDWENSGFYPEYWECTKAQFEGFRYDQRWRRLLYDVFRPHGDYSKELELEKRSWRESDAV
ncbi:hypothetical protein EDB81DRAFT_638357 [Dactylonectria macrodidyma]|uniref:Aminoglycoside phosphotransferase domain-containing protein n=1 Tax=Dactylonectria macrodidyma TaxID=307937 RepID=A0A9P9FTE1_9HYPO|nr:hypothetical protein EDB81DRAFT_638357 [Dactylonectria macrodidyma]